MNEKIDTAIGNLTGRITTQVKADEALKFTQAALNLAHVKSIYGAEAREKKTKGAG